MVLIVSGIKEHFYFLVYLVLVEVHRLLVHSKAGAHIDKTVTVSRLYHLAWLLDTLDLERFKAPVNVLLVPVIEHSGDLNVVVVYRSFVVDLAYGIPLKTAVLALDEYDVLLAPACGYEEDIPHYDVRAVGLAYP